MLTKIGENAKIASRFLVGSTTEEKNKALLKMAEALIENTSAILEANKKDVEKAEAKGISGALIDRLSLSEERIKSMADGIINVTKLADPVGEVLEEWTQPTGIKITKVRVPFGVIAIIYEARPNVTADAAALCFKTSNAVILRGGSEAINSNTAVVDILSEALEKAGFPSGCIQLVRDTDRSTAEKLMRLNDYVDVLIPRGGAGLIKNVLMNSTVPVIETGTGNCHIYVDKYADLKMAESITVNAKTQRPGVCNAAESLLVHQDVAKEFLPLIKTSLESHGVTLKGCPETTKIINVQETTEEDFKTEFLDFIISVKVVDNIDEAIEHITKYGTKHSECIITENTDNAKRFQQSIDASAVYVNASTRFTDGGEFGFGAEIGISTQKLHARGPMGLRELTSYKYLINGNGQIRR